jgi:hypothetical protein
MTGNRPVGERSVFAMEEFGVEMGMRLRPYTQVKHRRQTLGIAPYDRKATV